MAALAAEISLHKCKLWIQRSKIYRTRSTKSLPGNFPRELPCCLNWWALQLQLSNDIWIDWIKIYLSFVTRGKVWRWALRGRRGAPSPTHAYADLARSPIPTVSDIEERKTLRSTNDDIASRGENFESQLEAMKRCGLESCFLQAQMQVIVCAFVLSRASRGIFRRRVNFLRFFEGFIRHKRMHARHARNLLQFAW